MDGGEKKYEDKVEKKCTAKPTISMETRGITSHTNIKIPTCGVLA